MRYRLPSERIWIASLGITAAVFYRYWIPSAYDLPEPNSAIVYRDFDRVLLALAVMSSAGGYVMPSRAFYVAVAIGIGAGFGAILPSYEILFRPGVSSSVSSSGPLWLIVLGELFVLFGFLMLATVGFVYSACFAFLAVGVRDRFVWLRHWLRE